MKDIGMLYVISPDMAYSSKVVYPLNHLNMIQDYCDKMKLGYKFNKSDYHEAPVTLAIDGNMIVKTVEDLGNVIFYLPKYISDEQAMWFYDNKDKFKNFNIVSAYIIDSKKEEYSTIDGIDNIRNYINKGNVLWSKYRIGHRR